MKALGFVMMVAGVLVAAPGYADSGADVLKAKGCLNCHATDQKKVGPAFKEIAAKFKDKKGAETELIAKLKEGKGHMKANASDADLKAAVAQVLATK